MNDILRRIRRIPVPATEPPVEPPDGAALPHNRWQELRRTLRSLFHRFYNFATDRPLMAPLPFLAVAGLIALVLVLTTIYTFGYVVVVDGVSVGSVQEETTFETVVDRVERRATSILGYDYTFNGSVSYDRALIQKSALSTGVSLENYVFDQIGEVMKSYVLTVGGQSVGAAQERAGLDELLESLKAKYVNANTKSAEFVEDVSITYQYTSSDLEQSLDAIAAALTANTTGDTTYTVVKGDTYSTIAYRNNMSTSELMALNPQASLDRLMIGDVLTVKKEIPFLSVQTVDAVTYTQEIPCPVETREDSSMYTGQTKVITEGVKGEAQVTADVTYLNGVEQSRAVTSTTTLREPTTRVVAKGTKERPKTAPSGTFRWPLSGRVTSNFGYRTIFGSRSFHSGLDIAAPYGTPIVASDGGTVTFSGYKGSYGNLIIISHGNGVETYYAHCSSLSVSSGTKVYKGQTIAKVGRTGRATGNHCHFSIVINGNFVNPRSYLK